MPNAVILVIDRLGAGYLGPYGNTWCETPAFNQLASESILWENAFVDSPSLKAFYRAMSSGSHALVGSPNQTQLIQQLHSAGVHPLLVSDESELDRQPFSQEFAERLTVPTIGLRRAAESLNDTQTAHTLAAALDCLEQLRPPYLLWIHLRGMAGEWDAPREFRERFADEEDPAPPEFVLPPDKLLPEDFDPDEVLGVNQAFAGQVALIDECLATWLEAYSKLPGSDDTLLAITSPRGYPLGERGGFGASTDGLHEEVLHVPLLVRVPRGRWAMRRSQALVYPSDLNPTLRHWFGLPDLSSPGEQCDLLRLIEGKEAPREFVVGAFQNARCLRTSSWFVTHVGDKSECFVKPDDRWEINELSNRRSDIVDLSLQALRAFEHAASEANIHEIKLPGELLAAPE